MAGKGTYTALQALRPIETDFGKIAKDEEKDRIAKLEKDKAAAKAERDKVVFNPLGYERTGIANLDDALFNGVSTMNVARHEDWKRARKDPAYAGSDEYLAKNANRANYAKNLKTFTDSYTNFATKLTAMGGKLSSWNSDALSEVNGFFKEEKVQFSENKYGEPIALVAEIDPDTNEFVLDENGNPKYTETSLAKVLKGTGMYDIVPEVDVIGSVKSIGDILGADLKDVKKGWTITTKQEWASKSEGAKSLIKSELGSVANPSALAKRIWSDEMGKSKAEWDENAYNQVLDNMLGKVKATYDEKLEIAYNYAGEKALSARNAEKDKDVITPSVTPNSETGVLQKDRIPGLPADKNTQGYSVSFGSGVLTTKTEGSSELIENIWIGDDGKMYATKKKATKTTKDAVSILDENGKVDSGKMMDVMVGGAGAGAGWKVEDVTEELTETDFTNIAKNKNVRKENNKYFEDGKDFRDFLEEKKKSLPKGEASQFNGNGKPASTGGASQFNTKK